MIKDRDSSTIINKIITMGKRLTPDAERYLIDNMPDNLDLFLLKVSTIDDIFITKDKLVELIKSLEVEIKESLRHEIEILNEADIRPMEDNMKNLISYFKSRFEEITEDIMRDYGIREKTYLSRLTPGEHYIAGMIANKYITRDQAYVELEDTTARRKFYLRRSDSYLVNLLSIIPIDAVICGHVGVRVDRAPRLNEIYMPKIKPSNNLSKQDVYVLILSDLHIGSDQFLYDEFSRLVEILSGKVDDLKWRYIIDRILYIIIAGDVVDGIGIYPGQENDLLITDPREQYKEAYKMLTKMPNNIRIIIIPGNHDVTRKAIPRPPISKDYAPEFYRDRRFMLLTDPAFISLNGTKLYIFHGDFLNDIFATTPGISQSNAAQAMEILLKVRHIAPTYGMQTRIILSKHDNLVIPKDLNVFLAGHVHIFDVKHTEDNLLIINGGTWQKQTDYQKQMGLIPTPGIAPVINLRDLRISLIKLFE